MVTIGNARKVEFLHVFLPFLNVNFSMKCMFFFQAMEC